MWQNAGLGVPDDHATPLSRVVETFCQRWAFIPHVWFESAFLPDGEGFRGAPLSSSERRTVI